jgi:hypothetical protein
MTFEYYITYASTPIRLHLTALNEEIVGVSIIHNTGKKTPIYPTTNMFKQIKSNLMNDDKIRSIIALPDEEEIAEAEYQQLLNGGTNG